LNLVLNPDYGDITDVDQGTDLVINYGKPAGAQFPQTTIVPRRKSSPLTDALQVGAMLDSIPNYDDVFASARKTPTEIQQMLDEYLLGEEDAEDLSAETSKYENSSPASAVDKAFDDLLGS
jgi:hypothetical protein